MILGVEGDKHYAIHTITVYCLFNLTYNENSPNYLGLVCLFFL